MHAGLAKGAARDRMDPLPTHEDPMTSTVDRPPDLDRHGLMVRPARPADAEAVAGLIRTAQDLAQVSPDETFPLSEATVRHWIEQRRAGYVLEQRRRIVGYAELVEDARESDRVWIGHMMVTPNQRGLGLGRTLVAALLRVAERDRDAHEVAISAFEDNERALRCYRGCGFRDRATHRVGDRRLVEMRYRVPGRRPLVPLGVALTLTGLAAAIVLAVGGPTEWKPLIALPVGSITGLAAWALHWILPSQRDVGVRRLMRLFGYPLTLAATAMSVLAVLALATTVDITRGLALTGVTALLTGIALTVHARLGERMQQSR